MGQYYYVANLDKKEYLNPNWFGDGLKLLEFGSSASGVLCGLAILLSNKSNMGGGDLHTDDPLVGSWAGDRIVVAGDYGDPLKFVEGVSEAELREIAKSHFSEGYDNPDDVNLYAQASETFRNISGEVLKVMCADAYLSEAVEEAFSSFGGPPDEVKAEILERAKKFKSGELDPNDPANFIGAAEETEKEEESDPLPREEQGRLFEEEEAAECE